jgi:hypothetical protein
MLHYSLKVKMESLHILIAIFFICLTVAFCFGLWVWCLHRSINHAIALIVNYYAAFNTRLKNAETNITTLNKNINDLSSILSSFPPSNP